MVSTTLHCSTSVNLVIIAYANNVSIENLVIEDCGYDYLMMVSLLLFTYSNVSISQFITQY